MSRRCGSPGAFLLTLLLATCPAAWGQDRWASEAEALLARPGKGREAMLLLESQQLPVRQSVGYQWLMARAAHASAAPEIAADAVHTGELLGATVPQTLSAVRAWLGSEADRLHRQAMVSLDKGDRKQAVKEFLASIRLDPTLLGRDDRGLRQSAFNTLVRLSRARPDQLATCIDLAWAAYWFGEMDTAREASRAWVRLDVDPRGRWRGQLWLARIERELAAIRAQETADAARRAVVRSRELEAQEEEERRQQLEQERLRREREALDRLAAAARVREIDREIREIDRELARLEQSRRTQIPALVGGLWFALENIDSIKRREEEFLERRHRLEVERQSLQ